MTSSYRQNRTRLKAIKIFLRLLSRDGYLILLKLPIGNSLSFLKIKAHEVRALSSSWAFFDKVPLNELLKAAVWNQFFTFAKFYLRDMSPQSANLHTLGPVVAAQKVVGVQENRAIDA